MRPPLELPLTLLAVFATATLRADEAPKAPALTEATYAGLRDAIRPSAAEEGWRDVGWRASFGDAVLEAKAAGKPVFLWAMNGHPLGCT